jgi:hypothetical protein
VHYFFSVVSCMQAQQYAIPGVPHTLMEYVFETSKYIGKRPTLSLPQLYPRNALAFARCKRITASSSTFLQPSCFQHRLLGKRPLNMLIWMLYFTQQLGGIGRFTPGSPYLQFNSLLIDVIQRMTSAELLTGSRTISCLSHDLATLRSLSSFIIPAHFDTALKMADAVFTSANDQGDDHAITQALKLYRRAVRLNPASGVAWWGVGNCFEFWGARRCSPSAHLLHLPIERVLKSSSFFRYDAEGRRLRLKAAGYLERALITLPKDPNLHRTIDGIFTGLQLTRTSSFKSPPLSHASIDAHTPTDTDATGTPRARRVFELGVQIGLWQHPDQRPSTMIPGLRGLPWWDKTQIWFSKLIEDSYPVIREEMLHAMTLPRCQRSIMFRMVLLLRVPFCDALGSSEFVNDGFVTRGTWKKFDIYMNGHRHHNHSKVACNV